MQHKMIRQTRQLTDEATKEILEKCEYGTLSTVGSDNQPYGVPLSYTVFNDEIYFHCGMGGHKIENIMHNNKVSFSVVGKTNPFLNENAPDYSTEYESVIAFGKAVEVANTEEKIEALRSLTNKYFSDKMDFFEKAIDRAIKATRIFKIEIEHITGKANKL